MEWRFLLEVLALSLSVQDLMSEQRESCCCGGGGGGGGGRSGLPPAELIGSEIRRTREAQAHLFI